jgi:hypothetical protein
MFEVVENIKSQIMSNFNQIKIDPTTHIYTYKDTHPTSVSKCIEQFYEQFDSQAQSLRMTNGDTEKARILVQTWNKIRDDSCELGHRVHDFGEKYFYNKNLEPTDGYERALVKWWKSLPNWIIPVLAETRVNHGGTFAGTFDVTLYDLKKQGLIIADYKTNKDLFKNFKNKKMLSPFQFLLDSPYNHYSVQQSYYQIPLEDIGIKVIERWLIHLQADGNYTKHEVIDYTKHLRRIL